MNYGDISPRTAEYAASKFLVCRGADRKIRELMTQARHDADEQGHLMTAIWIGGLESKLIHCVNCGTVVAVNLGKGTIEWTVQ